MKPFIKVGCVRRVLSRGRIAFFLRWRRGDGNRKMELAFTTEADVSARRLKTVWGPRMADAIYHKEHDLNDGANDYLTRCQGCHALYNYLVAMEGVKSPTTVDRLRRVLSSFVDYAEKQYGNMMMSGYRQKHIARWRDWMVEKSMAGSTINTYLADLSGWFKWCVGESYTIDNYAVRVNRADAIITSGAQLPVRGADGFWELIDHLPPPYDTDYHTAVIGLLACSGLRISEASHLRFDTAWDQDNDTLVVGVEMKNTRTKNHRRVVPISNTLRHWLMILRMVQDGPYIIGIKHGYGLMTSQPRRWLVPLGCSPKHLRQWFRTALETVAGTKNFPLIDDIMGHRTSVVRAAYTTTEFVEGTRRLTTAFDVWLTAAKP